MKYAMRTFGHKKHYLLAAMIVVAQVLWGQQVTVTYITPNNNITNNTSSTITTYSATIPSCATSVTGHVWGGGGGGGGGYSSGLGINVGGGGGGGAYNTKVFDISVYQTFSITVGFGGNGGPANSSDLSGGKLGNYSRIEIPGNDITAIGGGGGGRTTGGNSSTYGSGGTGGTGTYKGGDGARGAAGGLLSGASGGAGGGGAGAGGNGGTSSGGSSSGSLPGGGNGGAAVSGTSSGNSGSPIGGGGSGGRGTGAGDSPGGNGNRGHAIITYNIPRPVISGTNIYCEGENLQLSVNNHCSSATYTWRRNGTDIGITGTTLTLNNVTPANSGSYTVVYSHSGSFSGGNPSVEVSGADLSYNSGTIQYISTGFNVTVTPRVKTPTLRWTYDGTCPTDEGEADYSAMDSLNIATPDNPIGVYFANHIVWDSLILNNVRGDISLNSIKWYLNETGDDVLKEGGVLTTLGNTLQTNGLFKPFWQNEFHEQEVYWASIVHPDSCESERIRVGVYIYDDPTLDNVPQLIGYVQPSGTLDLSGYISDNIPTDASQWLEWYKSETDAFDVNDEIVGGPLILDLRYMIDTTFWLVRADTFGCRSLPAPFRVQLFPVPTISISPDTLICPGQPVTVRVNINGTAPYNFSVTNSSSTLFINETGYISDTYTFTILDLSSTTSYYISQFSDSVTSLVNNPLLRMSVPSSGIFDTTIVEVVVTEIISITPAFGPTEGGTYTSNPDIPVDQAGRVTIVGSGFNPFGSLTPSVIVSFDDIPSTSVTVISDDTITCVPPPRSHSGDVMVSVTTACVTFNLTNGYHYEAMNITKVSPDYAPVTGGTIITILGTGLLAGGYNIGDVWIEFCGVRAQEVLIATNDSIVCITGKSDFSKLENIEIHNGVESRVFVDRFTYHPVNFVKNGSWSEPYNWETQTDDRILPYPGAVIHIMANCLQDIDLDGSSFPYKGVMDSITVYPNKGYTVDNGITLDANVFTLKDNASFLNFGTMSASQQNVEHSLVKERNWYVSSPVLSATTAALDSGTLGNDLTTLGTVNTSSATVPSDWRVERYIELNHEWQRLQTNNSLTLGEGYTVYSKNEDIAVKFSGTYNNSDFTLPAGWLTRQNDAHVKRGFNLVGNPFPSYWRWTETAASGAKVYSTIWYRTVTADSCYEFWSYNAAGNVAVAPGWNNGTPSGEYSLSYVPPMQAFWVRVRDGETPGLLTFSNDHRSHADHPSNMLRSAARTDNGEQRKLRIALSGSKNTDEILIYTNSKAQPGFDNYDSDKMFTDMGTELFTLSGSQNRELVINGLPEINDGMEIKLGIKADEGGSFKFQAKEMLNIKPFDIYLRDSWRKTEHKLSAESPYQFTAGSEYNTDRFSIVFRNSGSTNNDAIINNDNSYFRAYSNKEGQIVILNNDTDNCDVTVYDILGNKITVQNVVSKTPTTLNGNFKKGIYILRAGKHTTKVAVQR